METLISLEAVTSVPVAAAFDEGAGSFHGLLGVNPVVEKETDADEGKDNVDFCA
jgi:hypothetical protein